MRICVTGQKGYIAGWLREALFSSGLDCEGVSVRKGLPDFHQWDTVIHCAGPSPGRVRNASALWDLNWNLTRDIAEKAKTEGVGHFIYLSSMAVYGESGGPEMIRENTPVHPDTDFGKSKLAAEYRLIEMASSDFYVSILRLPAVYGIDCAGDYGSLLRLAGWVPIFPETRNAQSMLHITNLCAFIFLLLGNPIQHNPNEREYTIYCPQNREPIRTSDLIRQMALALGRTVHVSRVLGRIVTAKNWFVNRIYDPSMTDYFSNTYCVRNFEESVEA